MSISRDSKKKILVLASGEKEGGGSGFQEMVEYSQTDPPVLDATIVGVVSNHPRGGVWKRAEALDIPFEHWPGPFTAEGYEKWYRHFRADYTICSGWLKPVEGLDPARTINIHPGPLNYQDPSKHFGGKGMWGHFVHEAVMKAYHAGIIKQSAATMHFVTPYSADGYDRGPIICQLPVLIRQDDTPESLAKRVNEVERVMQSRVLNLVVHNHIRLYHDSEGKYRVAYSDSFCKKAFWGNVAAGLEVETHNPPKTI